MTFIASVLLAVLAALPSACSPPAALHSTTVSPDSTGAVIDLQREGPDLHIRALYVNADDRSGSLTYSLDVTRSGRSRSTNRQSGRFTTAPGQTDTLSTTRINVRPDDDVSIHLTVSDASGIVDDIRIASPDLP